MDAVAPPRPRFSLRTLGLPTRLTLAVFLVSVGVGYLSALVQLHFQHAGPGKLLPEPEDAVNVFHGKAKTSQMERLLVSSEHKPFNGQGSMRSAFTKRSGGWEKELRRRTKAKDGDAAAAEKELREERAGEIAALVQFIRTECDKDQWDSMPLPEGWKQPITEKYVTEVNGKKKVAIGAIVEDRCARCHYADAGGSAGQFPLAGRDDFAEYTLIFDGGGMSIEKLAQTSHIHLLGFAMLYGLTGVLFSLTSYPKLMRFVIAPLPLLAQIVDISFWWLARIDPIFAQGIVISGGIVALSLMLQIVLTLLHLFGWTGRIVLALIAVGLGAAFYLKIFPYVQQHLDRNRAIVAMQSADAIKPGG
ncbi:MAG: hypothetical protein K2X38_13445 [Gemmataceae bacterium]|nr:hypothetical protein [Gemmataceae bacterium]